ncbi:thiamine diphosphate-binding protein [Lentinus tigrinus ALCF2SS1-7]|uniref:Thiamine diphosphate-binding protein n=1 Tax=Lentinus tigrinus ALCF2SS1-6 TaxID=1328759 RepID=A0A5C2S003_9APHY|nr:thiamine diphosphate-binding protein [Lentinus tigrinus ALCF2SS1-6]RPD71611.1 thiamine diphosphate-binding protein [Lentinus tigrinus ALCF2SS1-7]
MYTTASVFFKTLASAGITHAFVNWGSDHSAFLEDLHRQRTENGGKTLVEIVTCPSEYVALSAAHGYAQVTGKPAAVIVHVDVGTQCMAGAVHNADRGQIPVLIFAGSSPFTANGELRGSKNEFIMWIQDVPDQPAIVRQYMRYTAQIQSGKNASKVILRALQIATSEPKGPVYLWARREVTDEEVDEATMNNAVLTKGWPSITMPALRSQAVDAIVSALIKAEFPLVLASDSGRNSATIPLLTELADKLGLALLSSIGSVVSVPSDDPHYLGFAISGKLPHLAEADVVLLLNCDVPWVDALNVPREGARVFVIDNDPLKRTYGWSHVDAEMLCSADMATALTQMFDAVHTPETQAVLSSSSTAARLEQRNTRVKGLHDAWLSALSTAETRLSPDNVTLTVPYVLGALREAASANPNTDNGKKVLWLNEGVSNGGAVWNHIRPTVPGSMFMHGGTSLGWVLGASVGAHIGVQVAKDVELLVSITGDGNFLFGAPTAAYWVARRYRTPFLMVVLNNRGWFSPKFSMRAVHPDGYGSHASGERLSVGFGESCNVDYGGIAAAAGGAWAKRVQRADELRGVFDEAVHVVMHEKRCAVVDCIVESI